jgi:hypothetical protein
MQFKGAESLEMQHVILDIYNFLLKIYPLLFPPQSVSWEADSELNGGFLCFLAAFFIFIVVWGGGTF